MRRIDDAFSSRILSKYNWNIVPRSHRVHMVHREELRHPPAFSVPSIHLSLYFYTTQRLLSMLRITPPASTTSLQQSVRPIHINQVNRPSIRLPQSMSRSQMPFPSARTLGEDRLPYRRYVDLSLSGHPEIRPVSRNLYDVFEVQRTFSSMPFAKSDDRQDRPFILSDRLRERIRVEHRLANPFGAEPFGVPTYLIQQAQRMVSQYMRALEPVTVRDVPRVGDEGIRYVEMDRERGVRDSVRPIPTVANAFSLPMLSLPNQRMQRMRHMRHIRRAEHGLLRWEEDPLLRNEGRFPLSPLSYLQQLFVLPVLTGRRRTSAEMVPVTRISSGMRAISEMRAIIEGIVERNRETYHVPIREVGPVSSDQTYRMDPTAALSHFIRFPMSMWSVRRLQAAQSMNERTVVQQPFGRIQVARTPFTFVSLRMVRALMDGERLIRTRVSLPIENTRVVPLLERRTERLPDVLPYIARLQMMRSPIAVSLERRLQEALPLEKRRQTAEQPIGRIQVASSPFTFRSMRMARALMDGERTNRTRMEYLPVEHMREVSLRERLERRSDGPFERDWNRQTDRRWDGDTHPFVARSQMLRSPMSLLAERRLQMMQWLNDRTRVMQQSTRPPAPMGFAGSIGPIGFTGSIGSIVSGPIDRLQVVRTPFTYVSLRMVRALMDGEYTSRARVQSVPGERTRVVSLPDRHFDRHFDRRTERDERLRMVRTRIVRSPMTLMERRWQVMPPTDERTPTEELTRVLQQSVRHLQIDRLLTEPSPMLRSLMHMTPGRRWQIMQRLDERSRVMQQPLAPTGLTGLMGTTGSIGSMLPMGPVDRMQVARTPITYASLRMARALMDRGRAERTERMRVIHMPYEQTRGGLLRDRRLDGRMDGRFDDRRAGLSQTERVTDGRLPIVLPMVRTRMDRSPLTLFATRRLQVAQSTDERRSQSSRPLGELERGRVPLVSRDPFPSTVSVMRAIAERALSVQTESLFVDRIQHRIQRIRVPQTHSQVVHPLGSSATMIQQVDQRPVRTAIVQRSIERGNRERRRSRLQIQNQMESHREQVRGWHHDQPLATYLLEQQSPAQRVIQRRVLRDDEENKQSLHRWVHQFIDRVAPRTSASRPFARTHLEVGRQFQRAIDVEQQVQRHLQRHSQWRQVAHHLEQIDYQQDASSRSRLAYRRMAEDEVPLNLTPLRERGSNRTTTHPVHATPPPEAASRSRVPMQTVVRRTVTQTPYQEQLQGLEASMKEMERKLNEVQNQQSEPKVNVKRMVNDIYRELTRRIQLEQRRSGM